MGAWGQEKEKKNQFWGVYWRGCHQNGMSHVTWFFDDLQQYYERLSIHPPKHGLPANYAIDSWPWLSRVSVLGAPALPLVGSCLGKTCGVLDGLPAGAHQNVRSYDVSFLQEM